jgi:hypothetical protein
MAITESIHTKLKTDRQFLEMISYIKFSESMVNG